MKLIAKVTAIFDRVLDVMFIIAGILLIFSMLSIGAGIASRYFLGLPFGWVVEISSYILLYVTFLVAAWVLREDGHIAIDVVINLFDQKTRYRVDAVTSVIGAIVFLILTWYGAKVSWNLFKINYFTETLLELPKWIFIAIICVGSFIFSIQLLRRALASGMRSAKPVNEEPGKSLEHEL
jgi:TRAP-type C4-dicarboxylate transport system permease small subunit